MHPFTSLINYLKRIDFSMAVARAHLNEQDQVEWYPVWMYELMETDEVRNQPYCDTISETVAGKVVLEIGAGRKALWAVRCAEAGAQRVYAVEANRWAYEESVRYLQARGIDNVHMICGYSTQITLPERCEVLVHDLIGDIASSEGMIPFIEDAKRRLLTPDAVHIPGRCITYVVLTEDPTLTLAEKTISFFFRGCQSMDSFPFVRVFGFRSTDVLSEPHVFEDFTFSQDQQLRSRARLEMEIKRAGKLQGAFFFLNIHFGNSRVIDTWPSHTSWATPFVRFKSSVLVSQGDKIELSIWSDVSGSPRYSLEMTQSINGSIRRIGDYTWSGD
jgi:hypothetical protein